MSTFADLKTRCASRFRDTSNNVYSAAEWGEYINDSYRQVMSWKPDWPFLQQLNAAAVTVTANTQSGTLPTDTFQVNSVYNVTDDYLLRPIFNTDAHLLDFTPLTDTGFPETYRLRNTTLELYPAPDHTVVLRVEYIAPPAVLTGTDEPVFPEQFHHLLVEGALGLAYQDDNSDSKAQAHWGKFENEVQRMYNFLKMYDRSSYPAILDNFYESTQ